MYPCCYATLWNHSRTFFLQEGSARFLCARCFLHLNFLLFTNEQCLANLCVQGVWLFTNEQCLANLCVQGLWMQMQANALYHLPLPPFGVVVGRWWLTRAVNCQVFHPCSKQAVIIPLVPVGLEYNSLREKSPPPSVLKKHVTPNAVKPMGCLPLSNHLAVLLSSICPIDKWLHQLDPPKASQQSG